MYTFTQTHRQTYTLYTLYTPNTQKGHKWFRTQLAVYTYVCIPGSFLVLQWHAFLDEQTSLVVGTKKTKILQSPCDSGYLENKFRHAE